MTLADMAVSMALQAQIVSWTADPQWDYADPLNADMIRIMKDGYYGVIKTDGSEILPCSYSYITQMSCDRALIIGDNGLLLSIIDEDGGIIPVNDKLHVDMSWPYYSEGLLAVKNSRNEWGYLNKKGEYAIPCSYQAAFPFFHGQAAVSYNGGWWTHISYNGQENPTNGNLKGKKLAFASSYVNINGKPMAIVCNKGVLYLRDLNGHISNRLYIPLNGAELAQNIIGTDFSLKFSNNGQFYEITHKGTIFNFTTETAPKFCADRINDVYDARSGMIHLSGEVTLAPQFDSVKVISPHEVLVKKHSKWGLLKSDQNIDVNLVPTISRIDFYHSKAKVPFKISTDGVDISDIRIFTLNNDGSLEEVIHDNGVYYVPATYSNGKANATAAIEINDVLLAPKDYELQANSKINKGFSVSVSSPEKVSGNGSSGFSIYVKNISSQECGKFTISVSNSHLKEFDGLEPSLRITARKYLKVNLADEDSRTIQFKITIQEEGMEPINFFRNVVFERTYKN